MAIGVLVLIIGVRKPRFYPIGLACVFGFSLALNPAGLNRAVSTTEIYNDKSISHRLLLWHGAMQMMAEHPLTGVGSGKFGSVFASDYQLSDHIQIYSTAINDFLTLGAERGIPALASFVSSIIIIIVAGIYIGIKTENILLVSCAAAIISFPLSGWFSPIIFEPTILYISAILIAGILIAIFYEGRTMPIRILRASSIYFVILIWLSLTCLFGLGLFFAGQIALLDRPQSTFLQVNGLSGVKVSAIGKSKGTIFYIGDCSEIPTDLLRNTLRPLARKGWTTISFPQPAFSSDAYQATASILKKLREIGLLNHAWFIAGHKNGGTVAISLALHSQPDAIACYLPTRASPIPELCTTTQVKHLKQPLLICAQQGDLERSHQHGDELAKAACIAGINFKFSIYHGASSREGKNWQLWIDAIDHFFSDITSHSL